MADSFKTDEFLLKTAYLSEIHEKLNILNTTMNKMKLPFLFDKVRAPINKLELWTKSMENDKLVMFPSLMPMAQETRKPFLPFEVTQLP